MAKDALAGNDGPLILAVSWPLASIATILMALRYYTNIAITRRVKADTYIASVTHVSEAPKQLRAKGWP
jgi:hypothetical protein